MIKQEIKITMFLTCLYKKPVPSTSSCMIASCTATRKCQVKQNTNQAGDTELVRVVENQAHG